MAIRFLLVIPSESHRVLDGQDFAVVGGNKDVLHVVVIEVVQDWGRVNHGGVEGRPTIIRPLAPVPALQHLRPAQTSAFPAFKSRVLLASCVLLREANIISPLPS